jgi:hypothetical protein
VAQRRELATGAEIVGRLQGLKFPATKDQIIEHAERDDAPPALIHALSRLPDKRFQNMEEVTRAFSPVG